MSEKTKGRTAKSLINAGVSCSSYLVLMVSTFVTRAIFKRVLGLDYSGVETVFLNIITMLSIVELGIGSGIVYKLYKPIADNDYRKIAVLINFYKKAYKIIAVILGLLGVIMAFFAPYFIEPKEENFSYFWLVLVFILYIIDTLASYLYAHKRAMFTADQRNFVTVIVHTCCQIAVGIFQIVMLLVLEGFVGKMAAFIIYLIIRIIGRVTESCTISARYNKRYGKNIDLKIKDKLPEDEQRDLMKNIKALLMHKIAGQSLNSTASIIVSTFVNTTVAGIYGNYVLITNALKMLSDYFFNGITASFGNLISSSTGEKVIDNFKKIYMLNFFLSSFFAVSFFNVAQPFVSLWIGTDGLLDISTVLLISTYLYMMTMRQSVFMARSSAGQYTQDRWFAISEAVINLALALALVHFFGINGVIAANILSLLCIPFWTQPSIVYHDVFHISVLKYYKSYAIYFLLTVIYAGVIYALRAVCMSDNGFVNLVVSVALCVIIPNAVNILIFRKTDEFKSLKNTASELLGRFKRK